jgi:hypothetical protein
MVNLSILYCVLKYIRVDAAGCLSEAAVDAAGSLEAAVYYSCSRAS